MQFPHKPCLSRRMDTQGACGGHVVTVDCLRGSWGGCGLDASHSLFSWGGTPVLPPCPDMLLKEDDEMTMTPLPRRRKQITPNQTVCVRHCFLSFLASRPGGWVGMEKGKLGQTTGEGRGSWAHVGSQRLARGPLRGPDQCGHRSQVATRWAGPPGPDQALSVSASPRPWLRTGRHQKRWKRNCTRCQLPRQWCSNAPPVGPSNSLRFCAWLKNWVKNSSLTTGLGGCTDGVFMKAGVRWVETIS